MRDNNKSDKSSANFNSNFLYIFHFKFFLHSEKIVPNFAANSSLINSPVITSLGLRNKFAARRRVAFSLSLSLSRKATRLEGANRQVFNDRCFETRHGQSAGRKNMHFTRPVEYTLEYTTSCVPSWLRPARESEQLG